MQLVSKQFTPCRHSRRMIYEPSDELWQVGNLPVRRNLDYLKNRLGKKR